MKTRGPRRLASITYSTLAKWTGMKEGSIRNAVHQGRLELGDLDGLLRWANQHRAARGLPLIGDPASEPIPPAPESPPAGTTAPQPAPDEDTPQRPTTRLTHPVTCRCSECYQASKSRKA